MVRPEGFGNGRRVRSSGAAVPGEGRPSPFALVYAPELAEAALRPDHPLKLARARLCYDLLVDAGIFDRGVARVVPPNPATEEDIVRVHDAAYVSLVKRLSAAGSADTVSASEAAQRGLASSGDTPPFIGMYEYHLLVSGAAITAARLVDDGEAAIAFSPAGGVNHHAGPGRASGFGVFNDAAVAIAWLRARGRRVMYVDLDVHQGNGVEEIFVRDPQTLTVSLHESTRYLFPGPPGGQPECVGEGSGTGFSANVALEPYTGDDTWIWAFEQVVPPLYAAFAPDALCVQFGADAYFSDPLAHLLLTTRAFEHAARRLAELSGQRLIAFGGGGYDVVATPRVWALAFLTLIGAPAPDALRDLRETAPHLDPTLERRVRRTAEYSVETLRRLVFPAVGAATAS